MDWMLLLFYDGELIEFKGNRMPVGSYPHQKPFTSHQVRIKKGDNIYLFSDGYADQFGGTTNRKMMLGTFKRLITENSHHSMKEQREIFDQHFLNWKGYNEQVDDVLLMGYKYTK
jgi:serine phosphatase RsbU (regulator of sigma subunit)